MTTSRSSSPLRSPKSPKSPKGPRPLATPRRLAHTTPSRQRPYLTPERRPVPTLAFIAASPAGTPPTPRRWDRDPYRLGEHWYASPLALRIAHAKQTQTQTQRPSSRKASSPLASGSVESSCSEFECHAEESPYGQHAGLVEDLVYLATAEDDEIAIIPRDEFFSVIDDVLATIVEEDRGAANALVFGDEGDEVELEFRTAEQLQEVCMALAEEIGVVKGELRVVSGRAGLGGRV